MKHPSNNSWLVPLLILSFYFQQNLCLAQNDGEVIDIGKYRLINASNLPATLEIFKLNVELYPHSANVYDSLGEMYLKSGDTENAILNYKKSLERNPDNNNACEMLKNLETE
jgi:tetratricopeptide (TPR) repeat protein